MPVYNAGRYLESCIVSILAQSEQEWELLAVDDFSTDATWAILENFAAKDQRIKIYKNQEKGIIPALRLAFEQSKGVWITRMDADDRMAVNKLQLLKAALVQKDKNYIATGLVEYFSEQQLGQGYQNYAKWLNELTLESRNFEEIYKECVIPSPCWMIHRTDFQLVGAFQSNRYPEDYDLCFRFYEQQLKVVGVPKILHYWRDYPERTSRNDATYADNRFLDLKLEYFLKLEHSTPKKLVLWGAGKKGKMIAAHLAKEKIAFRWICNQASKWGHRIHGVILEDSRKITKMTDCQFIIAVANQEAQKEIRHILEANAIATKDFFFFC